MGDASVAAGCTGINGIGRAGGNQVLPCEGMNQGDDDEGAVVLSMSEAAETEKSERLGEGEGGGL